MTTFKNLMVFLWGILTPMRSIQCGRRVPDTEYGMGDHVCGLPWGHIGPHVCGKSSKFYGRCHHQWLADKEQA